MSVGVRRTFAGPLTIRWAATMTERPTFLLVAGPPAAGKTTLAHRLASLMQWTVLDKDIVKSRLLQLGVAESIAGRASYDIPLDLAEDALSRGQSFILDAPAKHPDFLQRCRNVAAGANADFRVVVCMADRDERERRLAGRTARLSQWRSLADARPADDTGWENVFGPDALILVTHRPVEELSADVLAWLQAAEERS